QAQGRGGEDFEAFPQVVIGGSRGQVVVGGELGDAGAVDEEPEHEHRLRPGRQSPGAFPGADGAAVGGETAGEPVAGGTVDRQEGSVCDTQRCGTSWCGTEVVAAPVSPKRFRCLPTDHDHTACPSPCPKKLTELLVNITAAEGN